MTRGPSGGSDRGFAPRFFLPADQSSAVLSGPVATGAPFEPASAAAGGAPNAVLAPGDSVTLGADDSYHALTVLRMRVGDQCEVVGPGRDVYGAVVVATQGGVQLTISDPLLGRAAGPQYRCSVGLVQALTRPAVMEYALEKGTEVGADFFLLVQADASPRHAGDVRTDKLRRWRRIVLEAAKQSKQTRVPWVDVAADVSEALQLVAAAGGSDVVLDPGAGESLHELLHQAGAGCSAGGSISVRLWVGAEGGWSTQEREGFRLAAIDQARLGGGILRAETAGPVAVAVARLALDDW